MILNVYNFISKKIFAKTLIGLKCITISILMKSNSRLPKNKTKILIVSLIHFYLVWNNSH